MGNALGVAGEGNREQQWSREKARKPTLGSSSEPTVQGRAVQPPEANPRLDPLLS